MILQLYKLILTQIQKQIFLKKDIMQLIYSYKTLLDQML